MNLFKKSIIGIFGLLIMGIVFSFHQAEAVSLSAIEFKTSQQATSSYPPSSNYKQYPTMYIQAQVNFASGDPSNTCVVVEATPDIDNVAYRPYEVLNDFGLPNEVCKYNATPETRLRFRTFPTSAPSFDFYKQHTARVRYKVGSGSWINAQSYNWTTNNPLTVQVAATTPINTGSTVPVSITYQTNGTDPEQLNPNCSLSNMNGDIVGPMWYDSPHSFSINPTGPEPYTIWTKCFDDVGQKLVSKLIDFIPVVTITASPTTITSGNSTTISWHSDRDSDTCEMQNFTNIYNSSPQVLYPITNSTYTATCTRLGSYGNNIIKSSNVSVTVLPPSFNVELSKSKDLVKALSEGSIGTVDLGVTISGLPSGKSCTLYNVNDEYNPIPLSGHTYSTNINIPTIPFNNLLSTNKYQIQCTDAANTKSVIQTIYGQSGTLAVQSCIIPINGDTCESQTISWTTIYPNSGSPTKIFQNSTQIFLKNTDSTGSDSLTLSGTGIPINGVSKTEIFQTKNTVDGQETGSSVENTLDTKTVMVSCAPYSVWVNSKCTELVVNRPDLISGAITPTTAVAGVARSFSSTITNQGNADTDYEGVSTFTNLFQTATGFTDPNTQSNPLGLQSYPVSGMGILNSNGGTATASRSFNFTNAGTYYVRVCADKNSPNDTGVINEELNEGNNCHFPWTPIIVTSTARPDLTAGTITPTSAVVGMETSFSASVRNQGTAGTGMGFSNFFQTATGFDQPAPDWLGPEGLEAHPATSMATLGVGASGTTTSLITFTSARNYYMRACADIPPISPGTVTNESNEGNNCGDWLMVTVDSASTIDLRASNPSPTTATIGVPMNFRSLINNNGNTITGNSFYNTFKIATEANGEGTITLIGSTPSPMPALGPSSLATATSVSHTFTGLPTTRSVQACADMNNNSGFGRITEIPPGNENNNCSSWVNVNFRSLSGSITASNCLIVSGESSCNTILNWNTLNPVSGGNSAVTTTPNNTIVRTGLSGTNFLYSISPETRTFYLYHTGQVLLDQVTATASCLSLNDVWINGKCTPANGPYTVTSSAGANGTISPASRTVAGGATTTFTVTPNSGYTPTMGGTCPMGTLVGNTYTTGAIVSNCTVTVSFAIGSLGDLTISPLTCDIAQDESTCTVTGATWTTTNATQPSLVDQNTGTVLSTLANNSTPLKVWVAYPQTVFALRQKGTPAVLDTETVLAKCVTGTNWDVSKCIAGGTGLSGVITASDCTIPAGASTCSSNIVWKTINPIGGQTSEVTTPINITVGTGNDGNATYNVRRGATNFFLYHGILLGSATANAECPATAPWDPVENKCVTGVGGPYTVLASAGIGGTITPSSRTVASGATTTFTVTPNSGYTASIQGTCPSGSFVGNNYTTGPINSNCTVIASFTNGGGGAIKIDFNASPKRIFKGRSSKLTWTTDADSCIGSTNNGQPFDTGGIPSGSYMVKPDQTTTYTLSCKKTGVSDTSLDAEVKVSVIKFFEI